MGNVVRAIIASVSTPHGIYRVGDNLPWPQLQRDIENIKTLTNGHVIVVGPTTYSLLPKNLKHSLCIFVNHTGLPVCGSSDYLFCETVMEAIALATNTAPDKKIFFLGGKKIWLDAQCMCTDMYITEVAYDCNEKGVSFGPIKFCPELLSPNRKWTVNELTRHTEKIKGSELRLYTKLTHFQRIDSVLHGEE